MQTRQGVEKKGGSSFGCALEGSVAVVWAWGVGVGGIPFGMPGELTGTISQNAWCPHVTLNQFNELVQNYLIFHIHF